MLKSGRSGPYNSSLFSARPIYPEEREIERNISLGVIVVVTLVSGALFVLNFILISCYVKRKADGGKLLLGKLFKFNTSIEASGLCLSHHLPHWFKHIFDMPK